MRFSLNTPLLLDKAFKELMGIIKIYVDDFLRWENVNPYPPVKE